MCQHSNSAITATYSSGVLFWQGTFSEQFSRFDSRGSRFEGSSARLPLETTNTPLPLELLSFCLVFFPSSRKIAPLLHLLEISLYLISHIFPNQSRVPITASQSILLNNQSRYHCTITSHGHQTSHLLRKYGR